MTPLSERLRALVALIDEMSAPTSSCECWYCRIKRGRPDLAEAAKALEGVEKGRDEEAAWLIERGDSQASAPAYWGWEDDASKMSDDGPGFDWVTDNQAALRFGRKIDAERYAQDAGWNNVRICEHLWLGQCTGEHDWFRPDFIAYDCCRNCGVVRRADDKNNPCRGKVSVGPRATLAAETRK